MSEKSLATITQPTDTATEIAIEPKAAIVNIPEATSIGKIMSEEIRIRILLLLDREECSVSKMVEAIGISKTTILYNLPMLITLGAINFVHAKRNKDLYPTNKGTSTHKVYHLTDKGKRIIKFAKEL